MNAIVIGLVLALIGIAVVFVLVSGVKNITNGKSDFKKIGILSVPFVIFVISLVVTGGADVAGVVTMVVMMLLMVVMIAFTGLKGTFKF
jgi:hypothetical protein